MSLDKKEINDIVAMATELHSVDSNKFSEIKGILQGALLFSKKERCPKWKVQEQKA